MVITLRTSIAPTSRDFAGGDLVKAQRTACRLGGDEQEISTIAAIDNGLAAGQRVAVCGGGDFVDIAIGVTFVEAESSAFGTGDDRLDAFGFAMGGIEAQGHEIAQHGLGTDCPAHLLEHGRDVEPGSAESAIILGDQRPQNAQLGQLGPFGRVVEDALIGDLVAMLDRILFGQIATQAIADHAAVFSRREIHDQAPKVSLAMILRWISFDPPKIESLRLLK